jgi:tetratricopeptide (TPR) repeat protein
MKPTCHAHTHRLRTTGWKLRLISACLLLLVITVLTACNKEEKNLLVRIFDREEQMRIGSAPTTIDELKKAIAVSDAEVQRTVAANEKIGTYWRLLANRYLERNLFRDAYDAAIKALYYYPSNSGLYYIAGLSAAYLSRVAEADIRSGAPARDEWLKVAEAAYLNGLKFNDRAHLTMYALATLYAFELDRPDAALVQLERYMRIIAEDIDAHFLYARTLYVLGRYQDAIDIYDRIIQLSRIKERKDLAAANKKQILEQLYGF